MAVSVVDIFQSGGSFMWVILGMFAFGLFTKHQIRDKFVPLIAILSPVLCYLLSVYDTQWFMGYDFGFELLLVNGFLTFTGLFIVNKK